MRLSTQIAAAPSVVRGRGGEGGDGVICAGESGGEGGGEGGGGSDGAIGTGVVCGGSIGDGIIGDGSIGDGSIADGSIGVGSIGVGSIGDGSIGDGSIGDGSMVGACTADRCGAVGAGASCFVRSPRLSTLNTSVDCATLLPQHMQKVRVHCSPPKASCSTEGEPSASIPIASEQMASSKTQRSSSTDAHFASKRSPRAPSSAASASGRASVDTASAVTWLSTSGARSAVSTCSSAEATLGACRLLAALRCTYCSSCTRRLGVDSSTCTKAGMGHSPPRRLSTPRRAGGTCAGPNSEERHAVFHRSMAARVARWIRRQATSRVMHTLWREWPISARISGLGIFSRACREEASQVRRARYPRARACSLSTARALIRNNGVRIFHSLSSAAKVCASVSTTAATFVATLESATSW